MFPEPEETGTGTDAPETGAEVTESPAQQEEEVNPFAAAFSEDEDTATEETDTEQETEEEEYSLGLSEEDGFEADEVQMLTGLCRKHNLPADTAKAFLKDIYAEADKRNKAEEKQEFSAATKQLKERWGNGFEQNAKQAGKMIRQIGGRLGWSDERMQAMLNPHDIELMHEVARYIGDSRTKGLGSPAPVKKAEMTTEQIALRKQVLIVENFNARKEGNLAEMKRTSDEYLELSKKTQGANAARVLPPGY